MSDIDRGRAQQLMREAEIDALVLFQPEAFRYAVGAPAGVATMWGKAGSAIALVPAASGAGLAAVVSDHAAPIIRRAAPDIDLRCHRIWIDLVDLSGVETIAQVDDAYRRNNSGGRGRRHLIVPPASACYPICCGSADCPRRGSVPTLNSCPPPIFSPCVRRCPR